MFRRHLCAASSGVVLLALFSYGRGNGVGLERYLPSSTSSPLDIMHCKRGGATLSYITRSRPRQTVHRPGIVQRRELQQHRRNQQRWSSGWEEEDTSRMTSADFESGSLPLPQRRSCHYKQRAPAAEIAITQRRGGRRRMTALMALEADFFPPTIVEECWKDHS